MFMFSHSHFFSALRSKIFAKKSYFFGHEVHTGGSDTTHSVLYSVHLAHMRAKAAAVWAYGTKEGSRSLLNKKEKQT